MTVVFLDRVHPILEERLSENGYTCIDATSLNYDDCLAVLPDTHGIVIRSRFKIDKDLLSHCHALKFIARSGAGMENIDIDACKQRDITLYNAPEGNRNAVGEHALGMLLSLFNNISFADTEVRNGKWDREGNRGVELDGKTVGLIGFGNNGQAFAKKLRGFDTQILAYDKYKTGFSNSTVKESSLKEIYQKADVISFHIPQNEETIYFANEPFFNRFKNNIYLINLSRGKIVETAALVRGIKSGRILGACLDVLEYEKTSFESFFEQNLSADFNYLLESKKVLLSPHVGGWTHESYFKLSAVLADKILNQFKG
ncbi:MAG: NAD(P)-dependent oxidoreductase [Crocinitomicaceae bacterium]|nr:NAD(P)-dependent oxidoreductase [Crocinitomicaceae bacterium]MDG1775838.1 NAD(P)-dependent oxidoreductase [Crocinitomicaceae bacterium]